MSENPYYSREVQGEFEVTSIGRLDLEDGGSIPDCLLAYTTFGELNAAKDNAILTTNYYTGTHKGWRDVYVGPEHALNPEKYFIVAVNQIGGGLSISPHNAAGPNADIAASSFPRVRIGDDVVAQERLLREHFGIESLALKVGISMGAQQTYEWAVRFPDKVRRAAAIAGTARMTPHCQLFAELVIQATRSDPAFNDGEYKSHAELTATHKSLALVWAVMGLSTEFFKHEVWRAAGLESKEQFLAFSEASFFAPADANNLLCQAWKWQQGDVSRHTGGDLAAALGRVTAKTFVLPYDEDMFFPPRDARTDQELIAGSELRVICDIFGHFALLGLNPTYMPQIDRHLNDLLAIEV